MNLCWLRQQQHTLTWFHFLCVYFSGLFYSQLCMMTYGQYADVELVAIWNDVSVSFFVHTNYMITTAIYIFWLKSLKYSLRFIFSRIFQKINSLCLTMSIFIVLRNNIFMCSFHQQTCDRDSHRMWWSCFFPPVVYIVFVVHCFCLQNEQAQP